MDEALSSVMEDLPPALDESGRIDANALIALRDHDNDRDVERRRCWWFVVWPDTCSMAKLYRVIDNSGLPVAISPLHDKDSKDDGELCRPHHHIIIRFPNAKSLAPVRKIVGNWLLCADGLMGLEKDVDPVWYVRPVVDYSTALRYLCHLDTPDKAQYPVNEVLTFGFIDVSMLYARSLADDVHAYAELLAWCRKNPHARFDSLVHMVMDSGDMVLLRALKSNGYMLKTYLAERTSSEKRASEPEF